MNTQENDAILAAEYVLGLVDTPTRLQLDKRLNEDDAFAQQVLHWQKAFSGLDAITPESVPSPEIWQKIAQKVNHAPLAPAPIGATTWLGWSLAAILAGVLIFNLVQKPETSPAMQPVAILNGTQSNTQFVVSLDKSARVIQVSALNVTLPQDKNLQLWLIKGHEPPLSLGLITQPGHNTFRLDDTRLDNQTTLAVSLEPVGGSTLIGPSGPVVFVGKVSLSG
ncbi:anti-sigma factor [Kluyvera genomosp. 1]|uniref:anti-sigma factor n=1 Tax=Kluyvera genomosp. 1 TaxID=2774053 RepID=UPI00068B3B13|nr:anti-sigma factor [Kluyvera genomosp. 1]